MEANCKLLIDTVGQIFGEVQMLDFVKVCQKVEQMNMRVAHTVGKIRPNHALCPRLHFSCTSIPSGDLRIACACLSNILQVADATRETVNGLLRHPTQEVHDLEITCLIATGVWPPQDANEQLLRALRNIGAQIPPLMGGIDTIMGEQKPILSEWEKTADELEAKVRAVHRILSHMGCDTFMKVNIDKSTHFALNVPCAETPRERVVGLNVGARVVGMRIVPGLRCIPSRQTWSTQMRTLLT